MFYAIIFATSWRSRSSFDRTNCRWYLKRKQIENSRAERPSGSLHRVSIRSFGREGAKKLGIKANADHSPLCLADVKLYVNYASERCSRFNGGWNKSPWSPSSKVWLGIATASSRSSIRTNEQTFKYSQTSSIRSEENLINSP